MGDGNSHSEGGTAPPSRYARSSAANVSDIGIKYGRSPFVTANKMVFLSRLRSSHRSASILPALAPVRSAVIHHIRLTSERVLTPCLTSLPGLPLSSTSAYHHALSSSGESAQLRAGIRATSTAVVGASGRLVSCFRAQRYTAEISLTTWLLVAAPCSTSGCSSLSTSLIRK